jgi:hypothetical protein
MRRLQFLSSSFIGLFSPIPRTHTLKIMMDIPFGMRGGRANPFPFNLTHPQTPSLAARRLAQGKGAFLLHVLFLFA